MRNLAARLFQVLSLLIALIAVGISISSFITSEGGLFSREGDAGVRGETTSSQQPPNVYGVMRAPASAGDLEMPVPQRSESGPTLDLADQVTILAQLAEEFTRSASSLEGLLRERDQAQELLVGRIDRVEDQLFNMALALIGVLGAGVFALLAALMK